MSEKCTWRNCFLSFASKWSLRRHVNSVHLNVRSFLCTVSKCDASFRSAFDLKRHKLAVHEKERNYKCSSCMKTFCTYDSFRRHENVIHGTLRKTSPNTIIIEKQYFLCEECGLKFTRKDILATHISTKHFNYKPFECHDCGYKFVHKSALKSHIFTKHVKDPVRRSNICCVLCDKTYQFMVQLCEHYVKVHDVDLNTETVSFSSMQQFLNWKKKIEDTTITRFLLMRRTKNTHVYVCHRSGIYYEKSSDRKRAPMLRGSKKLKGICPASIKLRLNEEHSFYVATLTRTHVGHLSNDENELKFAFLRKEEREKLAELLASGIPKRQILDDNLKGSLFDNFMKANVDRITLLSNKDLWNIETSYKLPHKM